MKTNSNIVLLSKNKLPVFSNIEELANLIRLESSILKKYCDHNSKFYKNIQIPKSNGGVRQIMQPCRELKGIQAWILRYILDKIKPSAYATAYIKKRNIKDNAEPHKNNKYFLFLDLEDFFPSITEFRVRRVFSSFGYSKKAAKALSSLCTCNFYLPQGAVTSPSLSNIIASELDVRIAGYTAKKNIVFTRYADDITLSTNDPKLLDRAFPAILYFINDERFTLNDRKTRMLGPKMRRAVTGLVINSAESKIGIGREKKRHMRAVMHHLSLGIELKKGEKYDSYDSVSGWMNYLKSVDEISYQQMLKYQADLSEKVKKYSK